MKLTMLRSLVATALLAFASQASAAHLSLIVTGVFDGPLAGGEPKVVELYALEDIPDLSRWAVGAANNGGGTDGPENILSGAAPAGTFIYIIDDNQSGNPAFTDFNTYFAGQVPVGSLLFDSNAGTSGGAAAINGDDAIEVFFDVADDDSFTVVGDVFGDINVDGTGEAWEYLDGWAYRKNATFATDPDMDPTTPSPFVVSDYTYSGIDANDGETLNATAANPWPIGTYNPIPEPATIVLILMSASMVGIARMRRVLG